MVGRNGLDYASPYQKYTLKSLPDEKFSGLHLMCLMYAGFKRIAPDHDLHMDLNAVPDGAGDVSEGRNWAVNPPWLWKDDEAPSAGRPHNW